MLVVLPIYRKYMGQGNIISTLKDTIGVQSANSNYGKLYRTVI